jgi:methylated-DNA-protein-cysteine methyltransferase-like protein
VKVKSAKQKNIPRGSYEAVWEYVRRIPKGKVTTYGRIAQAIGLPGQARLVGYALHNLPHGSLIPWHRVVNILGKISFPPGSGNFSRQESLLKKEGILFSGGKIDLSRFGWRGMMFKR